MKLTGENRSSKKNVPLPLCPPRIRHGPTWDRIRASVVRGRRLTAWAMAWPRQMITYPHSYEHPKSKCHDTTRLDFCGLCLPRHTFPVLSNHARQIISFVYICEQFLSKLNIMKKPYRNLFDDGRLESCRCAATSEISPDINLLVTGKQF
jgi:hypothetical protein